MDGPSTAVGPSTTSLLDMVGHAQGAGIPGLAGGRSSGSSGGGGEAVRQRVAASLGLPESSLTCFSIEQVSWESLHLLADVPASSSSSHHVSHGSGGIAPGASRLGKEAGAVSGAQAGAFVNGGGNEPVRRKHIAVLVDGAGADLAHCTDLALYFLLWGRSLFIPSPNFS